MTTATQTLATRRPRAGTILWQPGERPRTMLIVNPRATTVSSRVKNLVTYALRGRYELEAVETEAPGHATDLARRAAEREFDLVVSFGGDGTLNEVANGLVGSDVAVAVLPGGSTNVVCRMLGVPLDLIDATDRLLGAADAAPLRRIDLGSVNGRHFIFSSGVGVDAEAVRWVDARPPVKARGAYLWFGYAAIMRYLADYRGSPPRMRASVDGQEVEGVSAVVQNSDPFTYLRNRPLSLCEEVSIDSGALSLMVMHRGLTRDAVSFGARLLSPARVSRHRQVTSFTRVDRAGIVAIGAEGAPRPLPVQVDGDYIGDHASIEYRAHPKALTVLG